MNRRTAMRSINRGIFTLALATLGAAMPARAAFAAAVTQVKGEQTVVFAGGCFWGIQSVFQHTKGVISATSGYAGGHVEKPSYDDVSTGRTGHAESVKVVFD